METKPFLSLGKFHTSVCWFIILRFKIKVPTTGQLNQNATKQKQLPVNRIQLTKRRVSGQCQGIFLQQFQFIFSTFWFDWRYVEHHASPTFVRHAFLPILPDLTKTCWLSIVCYIIVWSKQKLSVGYRVLAHSARIHAHIHTHLLAAAALSELMTRLVWLRSDFSFSRYFPSRRHTVFQLFLNLGGDYLPERESAITSVV